MSSAEGHHLVKIKLGKRAAGSRASRARSCIFKGAPACPLPHPRLPASPLTGLGSPGGGLEARGCASSTAHLLLGVSAGGGSSLTFTAFKPWFLFAALLLAFSMLSSFGDPANISRKPLGMAVKALCELSWASPPPCPQLLHGLLPRTTWNSFPLSSPSHPLSGVLCLEFPLTSAWLASVLL